jgi:uncharacterized membrane protein YkoI
MDDDMIPFSELIKITKNDMGNLITETELTDENNLLYQVVVSVNDQKMCIKEVGYYDDIQGKPSITLYKNHNDVTNIDVTMISHIYTEKELTICKEHNLYGMISLMVQDASQNILELFTFTFVPSNNDDVRVSKRCEIKEHTHDGDYIIHDEIRNKKTKQFAPTCGNDMMCKLIKSCDMSKYMCAK